MYEFHMNFHSNSIIYRTSVSLPVKEMDILTNLHLLLDFHAISLFVSIMATRASNNDWCATK